ncbi:hypothetical protein [Lactobacillus amylovorus]|uniref:hypothetical protein n=1 Tax=Lactobacillus amylovorus TaxID=1604 RepID=UPI00232FDD04|nr:hypothetical protein [Lactobacillus amylovorus]MDB6234313.1 hypothetical protein [Lactobacillus amylovorus]MDB6248433.1 hypothetical protein [Lactobacillus amylovorus]MDB6259510.1 hypothetical protein [Lactobacillus amylovorus]MDB6264892.1 hypothetical protein [Lactobacillus amylovorus]
MTMEKEKISQVNFKMPEKDKKEVTAIFKYYGLDLSTGILFVFERSSAYKEYSFNFKASDGIR